MKIVTQGAGYVWFLAHHYSVLSEKGPPFNTYRRIQMKGPQSPPESKHCSQHKCIINHGTIWFHIWLERNDLRTVIVGYSVLSWFGWNSAGLILRLERTAATPEWTCPISIFIGLCGYAQKVVSVREQIKSVKYTWYIIKWQINKDTSIFYKNSIENYIFVWGNSKHD